ncbi:MAG: hypothetical protein R3E50_03265 [Halioglobus sp.]
MDWPKPTAPTTNKTAFSRLKAYSQTASRPAVSEVAGTGVTTMSKIQRSNKESKKPSALTPKEKKAAKRDKKKAAGHTPFVIKDN